MGKVAGRLLPESGALGPGIAGKLREVGSEVGSQAAAQLKSKAGDAHPSAAVAVLRSFALLGEVGRPMRVLARGMIASGTRVGHRHIKANVR